MVERQITEAELEALDKTTDVIIDMVNELEPNQYRAATLVIARSKQIAGATRGLADAAYLAGLEAGIAAAGGVVTS